MPPRLLMLAMLAQCLGSESFADHSLFQAATSTSQLWNSSQLHVGACIVQAFTSEHVDPHKLLNLLPAHELAHVRAVLLERLGHHQEALRYSPKSAAAQQFSVQEMQNTS